MEAVWQRPPRPKQEARVAMLALAQAEPTRPQVALALAQMAPSRAQLSKARALAALARAQAAQAAQARAQATLARAQAALARAQAALARARLVAVQCLAPALMAERTSTALTVLVAAAPGLVPFLPACLPVPLAPC